MARAFLIAVILFCSITYAGAQEKPIDYINSNLSEIAKSKGWDITTLNTAANEDYMTQREKDVILAINMVRTNPRKFTVDFIMPLEKCFVKKIMKVPGGEPVITDEGVKAVYELMKVLPKADASEVLKPSKGLRFAAADIAMYQEKTGKTGHIGEKGETLPKRVAKYGTYTNTIAENVSYGEESALMVIVSLLIDDGVKTRGHRTNILNPSHKLVGVKWGEHPKFERMCAMTFAVDFSEKK